MKTARTSGLMLAMLLAATAQADDLREELQRCAELENEQVRLACYDALARISAETVSEAHSEDAGAAAPPETPEAAASPEPEQDSGKSLTDRFFGMLPGSDDGDNKIESRVVGEIEGLRRGKRFELENGQVWRQVDDTNRNYSATNPKVEIKEGFMNSYRMRLEGINARIRVRRVK